MGNAAHRSATTVCEGAHTEGKRRYAWLEDYLDRKEPGLLDPGPLR
jgi:hypothetical protein